MFGIFHIYDVDGGFGDAVQTEDLLFVTADEQKANDYVQRWSNPHVYDKPYAELECGLLVVRKLDSLEDADPDASPFDYLPRWMKDEEDD